MKLVVTRAHAVSGEIVIPSDKSLTHRSYLLGAIANGPSRIENPLRGEDCESTRHCLEQLGTRFEDDGTFVTVIPAKEWSQPTEPLDCGNSGTTMRLLSGLVASRPLSVTMKGDASLSRRPMKRIAKPLNEMGALFIGETPPLTIQGGQLHGITYHSEVASAQVKSCVLLAGLRADGKTVLHEPTKSRDHTERMLTAMGASITVDGNSVAIEPSFDLKPFEMRVPGDISSAAFWLVTGALLAEQPLTLIGVNVNPTRTGILDVLNQVGATVAHRNPRDENGEPVADLEIIRDGTKPFVIEGSLVPRLIDEIPVLAVLATQLSGETIIRDARELRVKETDRIGVVSAGLRAMGANVEATEDGFVIQGPTPLKGAIIDASGDHRIGMAFAIAGLVAEGETVIENADSIQTSYPNFESHLRSIVKS